MEGGRLLPPLIFLKNAWGNSAWDYRTTLRSPMFGPKGFHSGNAFANDALGALTRHWTLSGIERFQSGPYSTINVSGFDTNTDGSTANDRPIISNPTAPFQSAAVDGSFIGSAQGTYYDVATYRGGVAGVAAGTKVVVDPSTKYFTTARGQSFLHQEVGRDTFLQPGYQQHDLAIEKGIGLSYLKFERGLLTLRVEANDIGNHNNVAPLGVNIATLGTSANFNPVISRTVSARSLVLWAKIKF